MDEHIQLYVHLYNISNASATTNKRQSLKVSLSRSASISDLRSLIAKQSVEPQLLTKFELLYCGRILQDEADLNSYRIQNGSCIHVLVKPEAVLNHPVPIPSTSEVMQALGKLLNPAYRSSVETVLTSSEIINGIISSSAELQADVVAQAILKDVNIISVIADPENVESILAKHPSLAGATLAVSKAVMELVKKQDGRPKRPRHTGSYSLDMLSDDEEDEPSTSHAQPSTSAITQSQLAAALAAVTPRLGTEVTSSSSPQQAAGRSLITRDLLSSALSQVAGTGLATANTSGSAIDIQQEPTHSYQSQLQQLREMGITDDQVALQALQAAGGNVHLALEFIYGGSV